VSLFSCLEQAHPSPQDLLIADGLFNTLFSIVLLVTILVAIASPLVRYGFRHRVIRLMGLDQVQPRPLSWWQAHNRSTQNSMAAAGSNGAQASAEHCFAGARAWENRVTLASVAAWLAFMLAAVPAGVWSDPSGSWLDQVGFAVGAGLLGLGPLVVNIPVCWKRKVLIIGLVTGAVAVGILEWMDIQEAVSPSEALDEDSSPWVEGIAAILAIGLYAALVHRRLRGLVVPLSLVMAVWAVSIILPFALLEEHLGACLWDLSAENPSMVDPQSRRFWATTLYFTGASLAVLGLWLGLRAIGALARLVERGWLGELSMVSLVGLGMIAFVMIFTNIPEEGDSYSMWVAWLPLLWMVAPVAVYTIVLGRRRDTEPGLDLLMLRVFSRRSREQKFLDQVQSRWRYLGAVQQAGGPDLVDVNVSPYECAMFLSSRLQDLYLPAALDADQLRGRFDYLPDREGRYRINEMFNFNTAWKNNVEQLILLSKTIMLDLRGLTADRQGTSYEIGLLARHGLLSRVVAIGDDTTDWAHVDRQLRSASASLEQLKRVDIASHQDQDALIAELLKVAVRQTSAPAQQPENLSHDHTI
jgi:hypothetical protein